MANPNEATPTNESAKIEAAKLDLPSVESPSISPADLVSAPATEAAPAAPVVEATQAPAAEPATTPIVAVIPAAWPSLNPINLKPRHKRHALLAASVAIAGAVGVIAGVGASGAFSTPSPQVNAATTQERKAMEQSIARLTKEITTLKSSLEATTKVAHAQIAKISERADRIERNASAELITGSISSPQTVPVATAADPVPVPTPRPAPRIAAPEVTPPARPQIVQDWAIRDTHDGYVYVQGHGDVYQVVPGAPLPGLGPVESIRRQDGRWVVTTPKGIIVSMRDRRYFE